MTTDSYRVILTRPDGFVIPGTLKTRDEAIAYFDGVLSTGPFPEGFRMRVMSEHEWVMSRLVAGAV